MRKKKINKLHKNEKKIKLEHKETNYICIFTKYDKNVYNKLSIWICSLFLLRGKKTKSKVSSS